MRFALREAFSASFRASARWGHSNRSCRGSGGPAVHKIVGDPIFDHPAHHCTRSGRPHTLLALFVPPQSQPMADAHCPLGAPSRASSHLDETGETSR